PARDRRRGDGMTRRNFIGVLGGAAAWPFAARAQQSDRMRRIGVLLPATADNSVFQSWVTAFFQSLALSGWTVARNIRSETRWATTNPSEIRRHAPQLFRPIPPRRELCRSHPARREAR